MGIRIGQYLMNANALILPFALAFFVVLSYQRLQAGMAGHRTRIALIIAMAAVSGLAGAWFHARIFPAGNAGLAQGALDVRFGSFGGYWGALIGATAAAALMRVSILACADALVPGLLVGGGVARIGCLFAGCCRGIHVPAFGSFQPFHFWAAIDSFALLATAVVVMRIERARGEGLAPGITLGLYLSVYGALRFMLEFARDLSPVIGPFTSGQIMSALQVLAGILLLAFLRRTQVSMHGRC